MLLIGFSIEPSLERMINWMSDSYAVNINAVLLKYTKTQGGEELLTRTSIISDEVEQERISRKKFQIPMSDEPGDYPDYISVDNPVVVPENVTRIHRTRAISLFDILVKLRRALITIRDNGHGKRDSSDKNRQDGSLVEHQSGFWHGFKERSSVLLKYFSHFCFAHISIRFDTPIITTSFTTPA